MTKVLTSPLDPLGKPNNIQADTNPSKAFARRASNLLDPQILKTIDPMDYMREQAKVARQVLLDDSPKADSRFSRVQ